MTADVRAQRLDDLVVLRAATTTATDVAAAIARFAPAAIDPAAWRARIDGIVARLGGRLTETAVVKAAWGRLGVRTAVPWSRLVERVVPGLALGVAADDAKAHGRLGDRDAWAAAILARAIGLWSGQGAPPTPAGACDAVVWNRLGLAGTPKRTPPEVRAHFVRQLFAPQQVPAPGPPDKLVRQFAAIAVGAVRADLRALRDALGRRWLEGVEWSRSGAATPAAPARPAPAAPPAPTFAQAVKAAAAAESRAVFDDRNVFISAVWRALRGRPPIDRMSLDAFKHALIAAHRAGELALARADLVAVMDPTEVAASETASGEARYHFVVREEPRGN